jgi:hypothetical protein
MMLAISAKHLMDIFHKNREISHLTMKKKANTSSRSHEKNQTRGDKKQTKNEKHTPV